MTDASLTSPYCPDPRELPNTAIARHNEGCLFWVYIGHGQRRWLDYMRVDRHAFPILNIDHVEEMQAAAGSPIAVFLACYAGAFDEQQDCLGEAMLAAERGPVAVIAGTRVTMPYGNAVLGHALLEQKFQHQHATLGELILQAKRAAADGDAKGSSRLLMDTLASAISPNKDELQDERNEHMHLYNLLGDPLLRLRKPQAVALEVVETAKSGDEIAISGVSPIDGRAIVELVCRRDRLTFEAPSRRNFELTDASAKQLSEVYAQANDQRWVEQSLEIRDGKFTTTIAVPDECQGHCHVRVYVEGPQGFSLGAKDVYVQSAGDEDERDPFSE